MKKRNIVSLVTLYMKISSYEHFYSMRFRENQKLAQPLKSRIKGLQWEKAIKVLFKGMYYVCPYRLLCTKR